MPASSLDELPAQVLQLRELIQEGHGLVQDLTRLLRDSLPQAVIDKIDTAVATGLEEYKDTLATAIENATEATYQRFDVLAAICLGEDPQSVRAGKTTVPDLLRAYIAAKGLPWQLVPVEVTR